MENSLSRLPHWQAWLLAARPKTLTAALAPVLSTTSLVYSLHHSVDAWISIFALLSSFCIQIGTNFVNDAADFKKGADTSERIGPMRVTQMGYFNYSQVMKMAGAFFFAAFLFGIPLVYAGGWPIVVIGVLSLFFGYSYTAGPFPLAYLGLGDLFVILFFGFVAVGGLFFLQTRELNSSAMILSLQVGLHATVLIAINNLRDIFQDQKAHKRTLAVKLGLRGARWEIAALVFLPFVLSFFWLWQGSAAAFVLSMLPLPLAIKLVKNIFSTEPSGLYNKYLGMGAGLHLLFSLCLSLGFLLK